MNTILITGASGFVGPHLIRDRLRRGDTVFGTYLGTVPKINFKSSKFRWLKLDLTNPGNARDILREIRPKALIHLAAQSNPRFSWKIPDRTLAVNTLGTVHLLEAVRRYVPRARFLFASTNLVYGKTFRLNKPAGEQAVCLPENPYAMSKQLAELACLDYFNKFNLDIVIARPFNHIGCGQSEDFVFADWCRQIALAEIGRHAPILEVGNLNARRDFLHVQDVIKAYDLLLKKGRSGEIYNICTGKSIVLRTYIQFLLGLSKIPMRLQIKKRRLRTDDPRIVVGNAQKIRKLGWAPGQTIFQALREMLAEWRMKV